MCSEAQVGFNRALPPCNCVGKMVKYVCLCIIRLSPFITVITPFRMLYGREMDDLQTFTITITLYAALLYVPDSIGEWPIRCPCEPACAALPAS